MRMRIKPNLPIGFWINRVFLQSWLIDSAFGLRLMSSETSLQQEPPRRLFRLRLHHQPTIQIIKLTSIYLRKQNKINILPNSLHTHQHTFTTHVHDLMSQGDILRTITHMPLYNRLPTTTTLTTIPIIPTTTTTVGPTNTYKATFEESSNFPTTFFGKVFHHMYGNITSHNKALPNNSTTPDLRTILQTLPVQRFLPLPLPPTTSTSSRCFRSIATATCSTRSSSESSI